MDNLIQYLSRISESDTPPIVTEVMLRLADKYSKSPEPVLSQAEFDVLPRHMRGILICNVPGCDSVVCTYGMLCVEHYDEMEEENKESLSCLKMVIVLWCLITLCTRMIWKLRFV